jgi:plastocyanin
MASKFTVPGVIAIGFLITATACGGGGGGSSSGGGGTPTSPTPTPGGATITITASGVSPKSVTISAGSRVTFVNNDTRVHDMASDPHPEHTACPAINDVGFLQPNASRTTGNLTTARTCGFHDHNRDSDTSLQGSIVIQ